MWHDYDLNHLCLMQYQSHNSNNFFLLGFNLTDASVLLPVAVVTSRAEHLPLFNFI